jgi:hypothetical protein
MPDMPFELWFVYPCQPTPPGAMAAKAGVPEDEAFILRIDCASGDVYELTVWTDAYLARVRQHDRESGDRLSGHYLPLPDLVVASGDVTLIEQTVADLIRTKCLRAEWLIPDELTASWDALGPGPADADDPGDGWLSMPTFETEQAGWSCCHGRPAV